MIGAALQLRLDQSSFTNLEIGALSAVAVVNATLNVTRSTFSGTIRLHAIHSLLLQRGRNDNC